MTDATAKFGLRPMLPEDVPVLCDIFAASVEGLTGNDYSIEQQEAWLSAIADEDTFAARLADELVLVATSDGCAVGFSSLRGNSEIDFLYVHPDVARQGVATKLVDALEKLAAARGTTCLTVDASDTARAFFDARGYIAQHRNTVLRGDQWLSNTTMTRNLAQAGQRGAANENQRHGP